MVFPSWRCECGNVFQARWAASALAWPESADAICLVRDIDTDAGSGSPAMVLAGSSARRAGEGQ